MDGLEEENSRQVLEQIELMVKEGKHRDLKRTGFYTQAFRKLVAKGALLGISAEELTAVGGMSVPSLCIWKRKYLGDAKASHPSSRSGGEVEFRSVMVSADNKPRRHDGPTMEGLFTFELPGHVVLKTTADGLCRELIDFLAQLR